MKRSWGHKHYLPMSKRITLTLITVCSFTFQSIHAQTDFNIEAIKTTNKFTSNDKSPQESVALLVFGGSNFDTNFAGSGEIWINKWGISTQLFENKSSALFGLPTNSEYFNLDIKRLFGNKDQSNFELGLGWQELSIDSQFDASGPRISFGGNLKLLKSFKIYGSTSYFPDLDDSINNNNTTAYEFEAGLLYSPLPSLSLNAGYRAFDPELKDPKIESLNPSAGFLIGSDWSW